MSDYSEEIKWKRASYLLTRFNETPSSYGIDLREINTFYNYNDISSPLVPDTVSGKVDFFKERYWALASKLAHPIDTKYFILCCFLGKTIADRTLLHLYTSYVQVGVDPLFPVFTEVNNSFIDRLNGICNKYTVSLVSLDYSAIISRNIKQLCNYMGTKDMAPLWLLRNRAM